MKNQKLTIDEIINVPNTSTSNLFKSLSKEHKDSDSEVLLNPPKYYLYMSLITYRSVNILEDKSLMKPDFPALPPIGLERVVLPIE